VIVDLQLISILGKYSKSIRAISLTASASATKYKIFEMNLKINFNLFFKMCTDQQMFLLAWNNVFFLIPSIRRFKQKFKRLCFVHLLSYWRPVDTSYIWRVFHVPPMGKRGNVICFTYAEVFNIFIILNTCFRFINIILWYLGNNFGRQCGADRNLKHRHNPYA
jgi:hypothetical protein